MAKVYSFSVPDSETQLISILDELKARKALSHEVVRILKVFYQGSNHNRELISKELMTLLEIKNKLEEFMKWKEEIEPKILEMEEKLKEKQEKEEIEKNLPLIRKLREVVFDDIHEIMNNGKIVSPEQAIKARLTTFATEHKLNYPDARDLFFKAFPELKGELGGRL
ncbi:hypothetical protein [Geoglobus acetivorans]|uniref:Uncharacterized protein n=1 Tax=Geoglobus acetivorans TaxID=565033 RepID=A0A0A7GJJ7_GEOAI|nr:hypothetical protein GACE_2115 [Geoglobus acetivorans]